MLAAINHQPVDRIPTDIWATGEVWAKLRNHFGEGVDINKELHIDGFGGTSPAYIGPALPVVGEGESVDFWGIRNRRVPHEGGAYDEQCFYPLASDGTGYILAPCHNLQVVTPVENIIAMYDEAWKYGKISEQRSTT